MKERKIVLFILSVIMYCLYSVHMWHAKVKNVNTQTENEIQTQINTQPASRENALKLAVKTKVIPLYYENACSILEVFTQKPVIIIKERNVRDKKKMETDNHTITVIGITVFLVILALNAVLDVVKVKEEERAKKKLNKSGERRQSLSEFAKTKSLRRESSKIGLQLFQIAESYISPTEEKACKRQTRPYNRGDSTNSYLSERKLPHTDGSGPSSAGETPGEMRLVKRQSVAKLFGARPVPMLRRSSFPALPLNPDVQALMLGHRQQSVDSDDEGDGRGRRVRIIRRY